MKGCCVLFVVLFVFITGCETANVKSEAGIPSSGETIVTMSPVLEAAHYLAGKYGAEHVLVVYDIDNTLLTMTHNLGSDQWYAWQDSHDTPEGEKWIKRFDCLLAVQGILYRLGDMTVTDPSVFKVVKQLQDEGYAEMVLTSRGPQFRTVTYRELRRNNLLFRDSSPGPKGGSPNQYLPYDENKVVGFTPDEIADFKLIGDSTRPRPVLYEDGIYMTSGQHKGAMLRLLLSRYDLMNKYKAVVFADDQPVHIKGMMQALNAIGIENYAYNYIAKKSSVDQFLEDQQAKKAVTQKWCELRKVIPTLNKIYGNKQYDYFYKDNSGEMVDCLAYSEKQCVSLTPAD